MNPSLNVSVGDLVEIIATGKILTVAEINVDGTIRTKEEEPKSVLDGSFKVFITFWPKHRLGEYKKVYSV